DLLTRDVAGFLRAEEGARYRDVLGRARSSDRNHLGDRVGAREVTAGLGPATHRRVDGTGRDRVHGDPLRSPLDGQRLPHAHDTALRADVVRLARVSRLRRL